MVPVLVEQPLPISEMNEQFFKLLTSTQNNNKRVLDGVFL